MDRGEATRSGLLGTRQIRHASVFQTLAVVPLAITVVVSPFRGPLVPAVRLSVLLGTRPHAAAVAAIALPTETGAAHAEDRTAPEANAPEEGNTSSVHHPLPGGPGRRKPPPPPSLAWLPGVGEHLLADRRREAKALTDHLVEEGTHLRDDAELLRPQEDPRCAHH